MEKHTYKSFFGIVFLAVLFISGCDKRMTLEPGYLEGVISIGPICPVERVPPDPACLPTAETYKAYPVSVFSSDGRRKILQLNPLLDGSFITELAPGNYLVVLDKAQNYIGGSNLPIEVSISTQDKTLLNINIDTGIR
jgi:hypothetical protein